MSNDKLREALDRLLRAYLVMRIEPPEPGHSDFSAVQQAREALAASKPHNAPSIDTCDLGHKFAKLADHPKKDGVARCPHCMATGLDSERAASKPEQNDRLCDALETIRSIAEWMNVSVQCVQNHPEEPPDYASEFDYKLAKASSELFNAIEIFDAQALAASKPEPQRCKTCDGTGDIHRIDGEYLGECPHCKPEPQAQAEPCPNSTSDEFACKNRHQCWEPCGELGNSAAHARPAPKETQDAVTAALGLPQAQAQEAQR